MCWYIISTVVLCLIYNFNATTVVNFTLIGVGVFEIYCKTKRVFFPNTVYMKMVCKLLNTMIYGMSIFTARRSYASAVLGVVILSVRLSACHTRALWLIQRLYRRRFYTAWNGNLSSFLPPNSSWWATSHSSKNGRSKWPTQFKNPSRRQISACNVSTVTYSQKKFNYDE